MSRYPRCATFGSARGPPSATPLPIIPTLNVSRVAGDRAIQIVDRIVVRSVRYSAP